MMRMVLLTLLAGGLAFAQDDEKPKPDTARPKPVAKGMRAPDFTATDADGKPFKLSERLAKGDKNIVLIFSRASW